VVSCIVISNTCISARINSHINTLQFLLLFFFLSQPSSLSSLLGLFFDQKSFIFNSLQFTINLSQNFNISSFKSLTLQSINQFGNLLLLFFLYFFFSSPYFFSSSYFFFSSTFFCFLSYIYFSSFSVIGPLDI